MENEYNETDHPFVATDIPLDDQGVMSLFHDTSALGITPDDIGGCPVGCLGIPEFGTDFVIQMVVDTKPQTLSDLIRISGLSHGTDVWLNNAQDLIKSGKATISTAICTRDDIMTYLINKGLDSEESFTIMERVRKGTVAKGKCKDWPEYKKDMLEHDVPEWYIGSCEKIKYMFPKAHAAAYVMMAYRIAYCKVNYPLAYYGAYFGIRADAFSYEIMCQGKEKLQYYIDDYTRRSDSLSKKEQDTMKDMHIVQEMYARGYEFLPIDIYRAKATKFSIIDGKLMPPFSSIDGMGETLPADEYDKVGENVWIAKSAKVFESAYIHGPAIIGKDAEVRHCAFIRGNAIVGEGAVVGNSTELKNVILFNKVQVPHYNYVGDSVLGYKAHMGAGSITSNVKSDKKLVVVKSPEGQIETGIKKFGAMLGDEVEVGCGTVLNPGSVVGSHSNIYPLSSVRGFVPANSIYKKQGEVVEKY